MNVPNRRLALGAVLALALALAAAAWAQDQDAFVQRYGIAVEHLRLSVDAMPGDGVTARDNVDRAFASLLTLARDAAGSNLVVGMQRVFDRARTAIANGSRDDLAVQAAVLEGAFQRLLYDAALRSAIDGDLRLARERLLRIADDVGFGQQERAAVADPDQPMATLRFLVEVGVAEVVTTRLAVARELASTDRGAAYRVLAQAYGPFLLVQDSPRTVANLNQGFVRAATALVDAQDDAFRSAVDDVATAIVEMGDAARERRASVPGGTSAMAVTPAATVPSVPGTPEAPVDDEGTDAEGADLEGEDVALLVPVDATTFDLAALIFELEEAARRERLDALEADLAAAGMPAALRAGHAERLLDAGYETLADVQDAVHAHAARALAAAHVGADAAARAAVGGAATAYATALAPIVRSVDAALDADTAALLERMGGRSPLRVQDAVVMIGQFDAVRGVLAGEPVPALQRGAAGTSTIWSGDVRDVLTLVLGLLAWIPLFLLNLAFGGGNRHWQAIGVALFLLWLPALFEGVVGLAGLLATYAGIDALVPLAAFSVFGSLAAQTVWAALTLLAVVFAISGLVGISRQFGLLGARRKKGPGARSTTSTASRTTATDVTAKTVDWDDDA